MKLQIRLLCGLCALLLLALLVPAPIQAAEPDHNGYIVKLRQDLFMPYSLDGAGGGSALLVTDTLEAARAIPEGMVEYIEPNYTVELFDAPNDPYYADKQWGLQAIHAEAVYAAGLTGSGVKVGFVDSGIHKDHEDLDAGRIGGVNLLSDGMTYGDDVTGHGTFAAGILSAQTNNETGLAGLAPGVSLQAYRVFSSKNSQVSDVVRAIDRAIADGCQVLNLSLGTASSSVTLREAVERAVDAGIIVVAAVGNSGSGVLNYPAAYPGVIGVGSVDPDLTRSTFSQRNKSVDFTAPGRGIAGLDNKKTDGYKLELGENTNSGTSYAAPFVTGLAALALEYDGDLTADGIFALLQQSAIDKGSTGYDIDYGYGIVDAAGLIEGLQRTYTITYHENGGAMPSQYETSYTVRDETITLGIPQRTGYAFGGWFDNAGCTGSPVTDIPAGSVGDKTFYALWQEDVTTAVRSVTVNGYAALTAGDNTYAVTLPYGTTEIEIEALPEMEGSTVSQAVEQSAGQWAFTVTNAAGKSREYTVKITKSPIHVIDGQQSQTGDAAPASLDEKTAAAAYEADAAAWFTLNENEPLPEGFSVAVTGDGLGSLTVDGTRMTYIPTAEEAGKRVTLTVRGKAGEITTPDSVTVTLRIGPVPASDGQLIGEEITFDPYLDQSAGFILNLYGNRVTGVQIGDRTLTETQYTVGDLSVDGSVTLVFERALLLELGSGVHTVTVTFDRGAAAAGTLKIEYSRLECVPAYRAASLTLTDNIAINYKAAVTVPENLQIPYTVGSLFWTEKPEDYTIGHGPALQIEKDGVNSHFYRYETDTGYHVFTYDDIPAKQMKDTIYSVVYVLADGQYFYSSPLEYSVAKCATAVLNSNAKKEFKRLAVDMLNYGAAAQTYFDYRTDDLANGGLTVAQKQMGTLQPVALADHKAKYGADDPHAAFKSASLTLESAVWLNYKGTVAEKEGFAIDRVTLLYSDSFTDLTDWERRREEGALKSAEMALDGALYTGSIRDIVAKALRSPWYTQICVVYKNIGTGETVREYSAVLQFAVSDFAYSARQQSSGSRLKPLTEALMKYGDAADAYFDTLN